MSDKLLDEYFDNLDTANLPSAKSNAEIINQLRAELSVWREDYALLQQENARLREAQRWIPVEERLPEVFDISESLEVVYVFVFWSVIQNKEVLSEPRKMAAKYSNAAGWVTNDGRKELRDLRYHVKFWKEFTPFVQPPEEK
jgi:hypothetical protein